MKLLIERGVEYEIVQVNWLKWSVVELKVCLIEVVLNSILLNKRLFNVNSVEHETQKVLSLSSVETK